MNRNVAARHALKAQNHDLNRQFERVMAAHTAQQRLLQAELAALQQYTPTTPRGSTGTAVELTSDMNGQHHLATSNGKYFVSPFNRHRPRRADPATGVSLPPSAMASDIAGAPGAVKLAAAKGMKNLRIDGKVGGNVAMAVTSVSAGTTTTTVATATGFHISTTTSSPALKLRQTTNGGLKLQPVAQTQVTSALSSMKTQGGKPVKVKMQLKVKLPPLKTGKGQMFGNLDEHDPSQLQLQETVPPQKKQVIRLKATTTPKDFPRDEDDKFGALRKIDVVFAGDKLASRQVTPVESSKSSEGSSQTLVLRCADGTLCRVPIGSTRKLQKLVATRDTILGKAEGQSSMLTGKHVLKSCLKRRPRTKSVKIMPKKTVHFAPDVIEVNRESKETQLQPTVKIGSQLYKLKLPSIHSVKRVPSSTTERYTVKAVSVFPKNKGENFRRDELESIQESEEGSSITDDDSLPEARESPDGTDRPMGARSNSRTSQTDKVKPSPFMDMVLSVHMKKKKAVSSETKSPPRSPSLSDQESRASVSPAGSSSKYVVSKVHDRWKVTIKNT